MSPETSLKLAEGHSGTLKATPRWRTRYISNFFATSLNVLFLKPNARLGRLLSPVSPALRMSGNCTHISAGCHHTTDRHCQYTRLSLSSIPISDIHITSISTPLYVDDVATFYSSRSIDTVEQRKKQLSINRLSRWALQNGFSSAATLQLTAGLTASLHSISQE